MITVCERDDIQSGKKPRGKVRKRFSVESRYTPEFVASLRSTGCLGMLFGESDQWRVWRRYATERDCDRALRSLQNKSTGGIVRREFRKAFG